MNTFYLLVILLTPTSISSGKLEHKYEDLIRSDGICRRVTENPYFRTDLVVGKVWRVYYAWELIDDSMCIFVQFKYANRKIINEIHLQISQALGSQPNWNASGILMHMGRLPYDFLLFADDKEPGKFIGLPNLSRELIKRRKAKIPLFTRRMKIVQNGTYLLISSCESGATMMASHKDPEPTREEIDRIVAPFAFGDGFPTCLRIRRPNYNVRF